MNNCNAILRERFYLFAMILKGIVIRFTNKIYAALYKHLMCLINY